MAKPASDVPAEKLKLYEKLVATRPDVDVKGATMPYTSLNGHMFSFLAKDGTLSLRLSADDRAFIKRYKTQLSAQHGRVMKEYVVVPASLLKKTAELKKHFAASCDYVASLKPKPTTRKKASKKPAPVKRAPAKKKAASSPVPKKKRKR